jgi:flagellar hook protein FlgE
MSFQTGLSGLNAAARNLDVIGHNIANSNTVGAKASRAEFWEVVASSTVAGGGFNAGIGVEVATTAQMFTQGTINVTGFDMDLAINGNGFFVVQNTDGTPAYTRNGEFKLDQTGNIVTTGNAKLMGYPTTIDGVTTSRILEPMQLPTTAPIAAKATTGITAEFNLDASAPVWDSVTPNTSLSTYGTALTSYDSQGNEIPTSIYMRKVGVDTWEVYTDPTDAATAAASVVTTMSFGTDGRLTSTSPSPAIITLTSVNPNIGSFTAELDFGKGTQTGLPFSVSDLQQNGYQPGEFISMKISESGLITARYSNGEVQATGQIALADFRNVQGLKADSNNTWIETPESGQPVVGEVGVGKFGVLRSGALEQSNVDLTKELVLMMTAQRTYQANAQTIKTQDQVLGTLTSLR